MTERVHRLLLKQNVKWGLLLFEKFVAMLKNPSRSAVLTRAAVGLFGAGHFKQFLGCLQADGWNPTVALLFFSCSSKLVPDEVRKSFAVEPIIIEKVIFDSLGIDMEAESGPSVGGAGSMESASKATMDFRWQKARELKQSALRATLSWMLKERHRILSHNKAPESGRSAGGVQFGDVRASMYGVAPVRDSGAAAAPPATQGSSNGRGDASVVDLERAIIIMLTELESVFLLSFVLCEHSIQVDPDLKALLWKKGRYLALAALMVCDDDIFVRQEGFGILKDIATGTLSEEIWVERDVGHRDIVRGAQAQVAGAERGRALLQALAVLPGPAQVAGFLAIECMRFEPSADVAYSVFAWTSILYPQRSIRAIMWRPDWASLQRHGVMMKLCYSALGADSDGDNTMGRKLDVPVSDLWYSFDSVQVKSVHAWSHDGGFWGEKADGDDNEQASVALGLWQHFCALIFNVSLVLPSGSCMEQVKKTRKLGSSSLLAANESQFFELLEHFTFLGVPGFGSEDHASVNAFVGYEQSQLTTSLTLVSEMGEAGADDVNDLSRPQRLFSPRVMCSMLRFFNSLRVSCCASDGKHAFFETASGRRWLNVYDTLTIKQLEQFRERRENAPPPVNRGPQLTGTTPTGDEVNWEVAYSLPYGLHTRQVVDLFLGGAIDATQMPASSRSPSLRPSIRSHSTVLSRKAWISGLRAMDDVECIKWYKAEDSGVIGGMIPAAMNVYGGVGSLWVPTSRGVDGWCCVQPMSGMTILRILVTILSVVAPIRIDRSLDALSGAGGAGSVVASITKAKLVLSSFGTLSGPVENHAFLKTSAQVICSSRMRKYGEWRVWGGIQKETVVSLLARSTESLRGHCGCGFGWRWLVRPDFFSELAGRLLKFDCLVPRLILCVPAVPAGVHMGQVNPYLRSNRFGGTIVEAASGSDIVVGSDVGGSLGGRKSKKEAELLYEEFVLQLIRRVCVGKKLAERTYIRGWVPCAGMGCLDCDWFTFLLCDRAPDCGRLWK